MLVKLIWYRYTPSSPGPLFKLFYFNCQGTEIHVLITAQDFMSVGISQEVRLYWCNIKMVKHLLSFISPCMNKENWIRYMYVGVVYQPISHTCRHKFRRSDLSEPRSSKQSPHAGLPCRRQPHHRRHQHGQLPLRGCLGRPEGGIWLESGLQVGLHDPAERNSRRADPIAPIR